MRPVCSLLSLPCQGPESPRGPTLSPSRLPSHSPVTTLPGPFLLLNNPHRLLEACREPETRNDPME